MKRYYLHLLLAFLLVGCTTSKQLQVVEHVARDTLIVNKVQYDSVYIDNWQFIEHRSDTVFKEKVKLEYRYKLLHDTVRIVKVDSIPVIREVYLPPTCAEPSRSKQGDSGGLTWFDRLCRYSFFLLLGALLYACFKIAKKFIL